MKSFKQYLDLDERCWTGYKPVPGKKAYSKGSCTKEEVELYEATKIITDGGVMNVHHNGHHIGNIMKSPSDKKTPYKAYSKHWDMKKLSKSKKDAADWLVQTHNTAMKEEVELEELFDILEEVINDIAEVNRIDPEQIWEDFDDVSDEELFETAAWRRKEGKSPTGGLNAKGIASYRRENPGSKLKKAVTGKVKPGSKAAKRRKSFCARMSGMKGPMKKPNGEPSRKALALRKWKCR